MEIITFGKYKNKRLQDIHDNDYIKYLCNYNYDITCKNKLDHICNADCKININLNDRHIEYLYSILDNKESYISYFDLINESEKNDIWLSLEKKR